MILYSLKIENASIALKIKEIVPDNKMARSSSIANTGTAALRQANKRSLQSTAAVPRNKRSSSMISDTTSASTEYDEICYPDTDSVSGSATKRLKVELDRLQSENKELLMQQISRETEIRLEVSQEMAARSEVTCLNCTLIYLVHHFCFNNSFLSLE